MKRYAKPQTQLPIAKPQEAELVVVSDVSISRLLEDGLVTLYREIKNLLKLSANGKLSPNDAKDLRDHLKLLFELKDREDTIAKAMSEEEVRQAARNILNETNEHSDSERTST